jgi:GNAT superfamily N-acetyltransferase
MKLQVMLSSSEAECKALDSLLDDRIYEFNAEVTGQFDGRLLAGAIRTAQGEVVAGFSGHTWGAYCELSYVWVHESYRGQDLGSQLVQAAEAEAKLRGCEKVILATHSFQAPGFYERLGYERLFALEDVPRGHQKVFYTKQLQGENGA